jgi:putative aldouronate transport system permease protein
MAKESFSDRFYRYGITMTLCIVALIALMPLVSVIAMSLSSKLAANMDIVTFLPVQFTIASWKYVLTYSALWRSFAITLGSTIVGTFLALLFTSMLAYPLSKRNFFIGKYLILGIVITMIFKAPMVPYFLTLRIMGFYNSIWVLIVPHVLNAYNLAIMRTFFKQFSIEIEEAAMIEGCGAFQLLFRIVLPSSAAVLATLGLFYAVTIWNQFQHPLMFISNISLFPLQLKIRQLINESNELLVIANVSNVNYSDRTLRAATIIFAIIPIVAVYPYLQKHFVKGAMLGSVKG